MNKPDCGFRSFGVVSDMVQYMEEQNLGIRNSIVPKLCA